MLSITYAGCPYMLNVVMLSVVAPFESFVNEHPGAYLIYLCVGKTIEIIIFTLIQNLYEITSFFS
jgi:hypothetical protein